jgi:hypothetical protein
LPDIAGVFVSYRRDDSDVAAGRLADDLSEIFGPDSIFRDVDNLEPGEDYEDALDRALDSCVALIAMIGPRWSSITTNVGLRRLEDPKDWVHAEISRALARGVRVIPVLISGTIMPREAEVPVDLKPNCRAGFDIGLSPDRNRQSEAGRLEAVFGRDRYEPFSWFQTGLKRCTAVARIEDVMGRKVGTGFLVEPGEFFDRPSDKPVLLTNALVISPPGNPFPTSIVPTVAVAVFEALGQSYRIENLLWTSSELNTAS